MGLCARGRPVRRVPRISLGSLGLGSLGLGGRLVRPVAGLCPVWVGLGGRLVRPVAGLCPVWLGLESRRVRRVPCVRRMSFPPAPQIRHIRRICHIGST